MNNFDISIYFSILPTLITVALSCSQLGVITVIKKQSMLIEAMSHAVILGIVCAVMFVKEDTFSSLILATVFGFIMVVLIEVLKKSKLVNSDAATGLIYVFMFALAIIFITKHARNFQSISHKIIDGDILSGTLITFDIFGLKIQKGFIYSLVSLILNTVFIITFYKQIKLSLFDEKQAFMAGVSITLLNYINIFLTSFTTVVAFDIIGTILVLAFIVTPGAIAFLISKSFKQAFIISICISLAVAIFAPLIALAWDVSISGLAATILGLIFLFVYLFYKDGFIHQMKHKIETKIFIFESTFLLHIQNKANKDDCCCNLSGYNRHNHLNWSKNKMDFFIKRLLKKGYIKSDDNEGIYILTESGMNFCEELRREYKIQ